MISKEDCWIGKSDRDREVSTLISLLDDPDETILPVVAEKLLTLRPNISMLLAIKSKYGENTVMYYRLTRMISDIQKHELEKEIDNWSCVGDPDLLKGLWLVNRAIYPDIPFEELELFSMDMAKEVWMELTDNKTIVEKVHLFNHVFFHRIGFKIEDPFLSELSPALLEYALQKRLANPVLFGLLYLDVAFRSGLPIRAMAFPGGYLPVCVDEFDQFLFYINIFNRGEIFGREQLDFNLRGFGISIPQERFKICGVFTLTAIYAESLCFIANSTGNKEMEDKMEHILKLFGEERFLIKEEDDDE